MRLRSHQSRSFLASTISVFLMVFSFNAYACFLPVNGVTAAAMRNGCSTPDEQPVRQFCDAFKTLGAQSAVELHSVLDCPITCSEDTISLSLLLSHTPSISHLHDHPADGPPPELLLKISTLRI